jgi:cytochrome c biogenesis protein CcmG/thiol:disulfide interchange protein DsbE
VTEVVERVAAVPTKRRTALWISVAVGLVVALFIGVLATRDAAADRIAPSRLTGRAAPEIEGPDLDGRQVRLSDLTGKYVLVNFFATWCVPCVREHPEMVRFAERHANIGDAVVLSVVYDDEPADVRSFFEKRGGGWPVIEDDGAKVDYGVRGVPESYLVNPDGVVLARIVGGVTDSGLERLLAEVKRR